MKEYTVKVVIREGNDEFWEELNDKNETGCDDVRGLVDTALAGVGLNNGYDCSVKLTKFEDK